MVELKVTVKCVKYILFVANVIYLVIGIVCVTVGIVLRRDSEFMQDKGVPFVFIIIGVITCTLSCIGCFGAYRESVCLIYMFAMCLVLIIFIEMIAGIGSCIDRKLDQVVYDAWQYWKYKTHRNAFWSQVEHDKACCGLNSATDYVGTLPPSCCKIPPCRLANAYSGGCIGEVRKIFSQLMKSVGAALIGHAVVSIIVLIIALILGNRIRVSRKETAA